MWLFESQLGAPLTIQTVRTLLEAATVKRTSFFGYLYLCHNGDLASNCTAIMTSKMLSVVKCSCFQTKCRLCNRQEGGVFYYAGTYGIRVEKTAWGNKGCFDTSAVMREDGNKLDETWTNWYMFSKKDGSGFPSACSPKLSSDDLRGTEPFLRSSDGQESPHILRKLEVPYRVFKRLHSFPLLAW